MNKLSQEYLHSQKPLVNMIEIHPKPDVDRILWELHFLECVQMIKFYMQRASTKNLQKLHRFVDRINQSKEMVPRHEALSMPNE